MRNNRGSWLSICYFVSVLDGDVYRGHWSGGVINGQGRYEYNSGDVYEGSRIGQFGNIYFTCIDCFFALKMASYPDMEK